jgi:hypothetical protein
LIPVKKHRASRGQFIWPTDPILASVTTADQLPLASLAEKLRRLKLKPRFLREAVGEAAVRIRRDPSIPCPESYRMDLRPEGIQIFASGDAGAYYALQTLAELLAVHGRKLPAGSIEDAPDFRRRGVYLDCSRGKVPTLETLLQLVEHLASWKVNEFQLYIENVFRFRNHPAIGRGYTPFTAEELLTLQEHCRQHHIRLVGSLASFGHMERILQLPQYQSLGELPGHNGWKGGTTLCPTDPGSIRLMADLYEEFMPLFEAADFNICGDEPWELGRGRTQKLADRVGVGQVYLDFLLKLYELGQKHHKRINVWSDIVLEHPELLKKLPSDLVMLNWEYEPDGGRIARTREIAEAKLPLVVCPGTSGWRTYGTKLQCAIENVSNFAAAGRKYQAEGLLNTDWGDGGHRNPLGVSLHGYAHGAAHSWNGRAVNDEHFTETFCLHFFGLKNGKKLTQSIRDLGSVNRTSGYTRNYGCATHWFIEEPLDRRNVKGNSMIDQTTAQGLKKVIRQLDDPSLWPDLPAGISEFVRLSLQDYALAARMECLSARRGLLAHQMRTGGSITPAEVRRLAGETERMANAFRKNWLARNKQSRLQDNLHYLRSNVREYRRLLK